MKRTALLVVSLIIPLVGISSATALAAHIEDSSATSTPAVRDSKPKLTDTQKKRALELAKIASEKLGVTRDRQEGLISRVDARARKFEETGRSVAKAKQLIAETKASFEVAKSLIEAIEANVTEVLTFGNYKEALIEAKLSIVDAQNAVIETHKKIGLVIDELEKSAGETSILPSATEE